MKINPNPFKDQIFIDFDKKEGYQISVYNSVGEQIKVFSSQGLKMIVDIGDQPSGLYFIAIRDTDSRNNKTFKVVKL